MIIEPHENGFQSCQRACWSQSYGTICQGKLRLGPPKIFTSQLSNSVSFCRSSVMNTSIHTRYRNSAAAILAKHEQTEPETPGCPQKLVPFYGHHVLPDNSFFFFQLPEILRQEFSAGASSEYCLKEMKTLILTLVIFWFSKGTGSRILCNFLPHHWRSFFLLPVRSDTFHYHSSKTKP